MLIAILISLLVLVIGLLLYTLLNPPQPREDYYRDQAGLVELDMYVKELQKKPPLI